MLLLVRTPTMVAAAVVAVLVVTVACEWLPVVMRPVPEAGRDVGVVASVAATWVASVAATWVAPVAVAWLVPVAVAWVVPVAVA